MNQSQKYQKSQMDSETCQVSGIKTPIGVDTETKSAQDPAGRYHNSMPTMPALKHLGDLADVRPTITIDSREQTPLSFARLPSIRGTLQSGDYSVVGMHEQFAVERKSIADLVGCCMGDSRERFERELHRLRGFQFSRLLIVGTRQEIEAGAYRSNIKPQSVLASLATWEVRYSVPVVFEPDPTAAGRRVESWAYYFTRESVEVCNELLRANKEQGATV